MPSLAELLKRGKKVTPFEQAHFLARLNASLPEEIGGLNLPIENTAMQRAERLGYDLPAYHGTSKDIQEFDPMAGEGARYGSGTWLTEEPLIANTYAGTPRGGNVMPLMVKSKNLGEVNWGNRNWQFGPHDEVIRGPNFDEPISDYIDPEDLVETNDVSRIAKKLGLKGTRFYGVKDIGGKASGVNYDLLPDYSDQMAIHDPTLIRSKFAAFDPMRRKEANLLASHPIANAIGLTGLGKLLSQGQDADLRGSINDYLNEGYDPAGLERLTGVAPTTRKGDIALEALGAMPGPIGTMATGASLVDMAENADWKKIKKSLSNYFR